MILRSVKADEQAQLELWEAMISSSAAVSRKNSVDPMAVTYEKQEVSSFRQLVVGSRETSPKRMVSLLSSVGGFPSLTKADSISQKVPVFQSEA
jgi:hypothetical protein